MKYKNLEQLAREKGHWTVVFMIENMDSAARVDAMKQVFVYASQNRDDARSVEAVEFLRAAYLDPVAISLAKDLGSVPILLSSRKTAEAFRPAQAELAKVLMQLYVMLPVPRNRTNDLTLPETKRLMLTEIAKSWRDTDNDEWAEEILLFFAKLDPCGYEDEKKMILDVVRNALREWYPVTRLTQHLLAISTCTDKLPFGFEMQQTVGIARVRGKLRNPNAPNELDREMKVMEHLEGCTDGAFGYIAKIAQEISAFDTEVRKLLVEIQRDSYVYGKVTASYAEMTHLLIDVNIIGQDAKSSAWERSMHKIFEEIREKIQAWKAPSEKCRFFKVTLTVNIRAWNNEPPVHHGTDTF